MMQSRRLDVLANTIECLRRNTRTTPLLVSGAGWSEDKEQHEMVVSLFNVLADNTSCPTLIFQNATVDASMSTSFTHAMCQNRQLRALTLRNLSSPEQEGAAPLYCLSSSVFCNHPHLESLNLIKIKLDESACLELCQMIRDSTTLASLSLDAIEVDPQGYLPLLAAIVMSPSLNTLRLSNMTWSQEDLVRLFRSMSFNRTITCFSLEGMQLDAGHARHLAKLLQKNKTLSTLNLRKNHLDAAAVGVLVGQGLEQNLTLQTLYLSRNAIGSEGAAHLAKYLAMPASVLQVLCLVDTEIPKIGCHQIVQALRHNMTLRSISLDCNEVWELSEQLLSTLEVNTNLTNVLDRLPALTAKNVSQQWKQVDFFLRANKAGRRFFQEEMLETASQLMPLVLHKAAVVASSPDVLFYFLAESGPARICPVLSASAEPRRFAPSTTPPSALVVHKSPVPRQRKTFAQSA